VEKSVNGTRLQRTNAKRDFVKTVTRKRTDNNVLTLRWYF